MKRNLRKMDEPPGKHPLFIPLVLQMITNALSPSPPLSLSLSLSLRSHTHTHTHTDTAARRGGVAGEGRGR